MVPEERLSHMQGRMALAGEQTTTKEETMNNTETMIRAMIKTLEGTINDAIKFDAGNNSAGTRVRKAMQALKAQAQSVRADVSKVKNEST